MEFFRNSHLLDGRDHICVTGGGAYKFETLFKEELGIDIKKVGEMQSLVKGMAFITQYCDDGTFSINEDGTRHPKEKQDDAHMFPKMLVSIGSGVSIIKVNSYDDHQRVSGTSVGGGTLLGLANLLIGTADFNTI